MSSATCCRTLLALAPLLPASVFGQDLSTPAIPGVIAEGTMVEVVKDDLPGHTEGPVGMADGGVLFASPPENRIYQVTPDGHATVYLENTSRANGLAYDASGRLIATLTGTPQIAILTPETEAGALADGYEGSPFVRPNDLVVDGKGGIYFTDPGSRPAQGAPLEQPSLVFYLSPSGNLLLLDDQMRRPNGIQLSPDGETLYIVDTMREDIIAYDVQPDGTVRNPRVFAKLRETTEDYSGGDGAAVDDEGRLYATSIIGVQVFGPAGDHLGTIRVPDQPTNVAFAGPERRTLYMTTGGGVYRVRTLTPGVLSRAK